MGKRSKEKAALGSASRRRTVLQIEPVSRRRDYEAIGTNSGARAINPTSISGIGLLGQYADNSDDEEQKEESNYQNEQAVKEKSNQPAQDKEVQIDSKLSDFFKEIEAIGTEDAASTVGDANKPETDEINQQQGMETSVDNSNASYTVPYPWEEVCDPNTHYIYYWNTLTNEVSWEMPPAAPKLPEEISSLTQPVAQTETWDSTLEHVQPPEKTTDSESLWVPPTESMESPSEHPRSPETEELPTSTSEPPQRENDVKSVEPKEDEINDISMSETVVKPKKTAIDMFQAEIEEKHHDGGSGGNSPFSIPPGDTEDGYTAEEMPEYPPTPEDVSNCTPNSAAPDSGDDDQNVINDQQTGEEDNENEDVKGEKEVKDNEDDDNDDETPAKKVKYDSDHGSDEDFAEKLLEEFLEGTGKSSNVKASRNDLEATHDDMEVASDGEGVIDHQSGQLLPLEAFQHNMSDGTSLKEDAVSLTAGTDISSPALDNTDKLKDDEDEKVTTEIFDLCALLSNKLDFLNISKDGLNKLQLVLLQMETRIKDWREGALSSQYLIKRLRDADDDLKKYEKSAAPDGWSCHWDSSYKRYFYTDNNTGESQWDYPNVATTTCVPTMTSFTAVATTAEVWGASSNLHSTASGYNTLPVTLDPSQVYGSTAAVSSTFAPATAQPVVPSVAVTQDPYRIDDNTPDIDEDDDGEQLGTHTPPPPGESPPPPPPDLPTIPPPPPPPKEDPVNEVAPPPPSIHPPPAHPQVNLSSGPVHFASGHRKLTDYSDLEPAVDSELPIDGQGNLAKQLKGEGSLRASPVPMTTTIAAKSKKKKTKTAAGISSSKVKKMSSLVQKWQAIKKQDEILSEDDSDEEDRAAKTEANIQQWRKEQITSGQAANNPNFVEIKGDWRERVRKAKLRDGTNMKADSPKS